MGLPWFAESMKKERDFYQISLKLLLKNNKGDILALKAVDNGSYAGYYDVPGGRIDIDEFETDFSEIISREISEEIGDIEFRIQSKSPVATGRHLIPSSLTRTGKDIHVLYLFFEAEYLTGDVKINHEHTDYQWLDLEGIDLTKYFTSGILEGIKMYTELEK